MKLSEAMRLGAMLRPQGFGRYVSGSGGNMRTCALASACDAVRKGRLRVNAIIAERWPWLDDEPASDRPCPRKCGTFDNPSRIITHLNDIHRWTREQIADWVATIEPPEAQTAEQPVSESLAQDGRLPIAAGKP